MKNGFTLLELLVVIAIIGIVSSVVLASLFEAKNDKEKDKNVKAVSSLVTDKFDNTVAEVPEGLAEFEARMESTYEEPCKNIPDAVVKASCLKNRYNDRMIQDCIRRYSDE